MSHSQLPEILPIGNFYPMDADGFVQNRCAHAHLHGAWKALVGHAVNAYRDHLGSDLRAVYVRGSVPAGTAVMGVSDLDMVGLLDRMPGAPYFRWFSPDRLKRVQEDLQKRFPIAAGIELMCAHHEPQIPGRNPYIKMMLKTQALCLWGDDPSTNWPAYRPGPEMCMHHRWLKTDIAAYRESLAPTTEQVRSLLKTLIRSGFESVMALEGRFATDLYPCYRAFARHFPEWEADMKLAIQLFLSPGHAAAHLPGLLDRLGDWLVAEKD